MRLFRKWNGILLITALMVATAAAYQPGTAVAATHDAAFVRTELPDEMLAGHIYPVAITAQNLGTTSWTSAANFSLATLASNQLTWSQWKEGGYANAANDARAYTPSNQTVATGGSATYNYSITAPSTTGTYTFGARMVQDGYAFFGPSYSKSIDVKNIVVEGLPKRLKANAQYRVTVSVLNKGANTWTNAGNYKLTRLDTNFPWSNWSDGGTSTTANLDSADSVATNEGISFSFTITTPSTAGPYTFSAQMKSGATGYSDTYTKVFTVESSTGIYNAEGETLFTNKTGVKSTDTASGGSYGYVQGAGNTSMWKADSPYSAYVGATGEYNVFMKVNSTVTGPLRIQMYGGPNPGTYTDFKVTQTNTWQWIGPLKVSFQSGYSDYKLTLWKLGGIASSFVGVDQVYFVPTDTDNAYGNKLQIDEKTLNYIVPETTSSGINVNANATIPVFYKMAGSGDSVIQLSNKKTNDNYATLRDSMVPGNIRIKVDYLGNPSPGFAQYRFTNLSDNFDGKAADTILKARGFGRVVFDHGMFFNPTFLDEDLMPGQSVLKTFNTSWLTDSAGNYLLVIRQRNETGSVLGTFHVAPNVPASTIISTSQTLKTRAEAENRIVTKTGTTTDSTASNGAYAYTSGTAGNQSISTGNQSYTYFVNQSGTYYIYARVRGNNHAAMARMQVYGSDDSSRVFDEHLAGSSQDWKTIGPIKMTLDGSKQYNLAFWRLGGESGDRLEVDHIEFIRSDYQSVLPRVGNYPSVGADEAYNRLPSGTANSWNVLEVPQPPKQTSLYVKLLDSRQMAANKETLNVALGSNMTTTKGATIDDWTIGGKPVFMTWYYPYREKDVEPNWQAKVTQDLQNIVATGYNVVLLQLFPQFVYPGSPIDYALTESRRLGIKVLPSIFYLNQAPYLMAKTGINYREASNSPHNFSDASDPQFSVALSAWYDQLYADYGDIFYVNADGKTPIMYAEEHGYGFPQGAPYNSRYAPDTIESMRQFRDWLAAKYGNVAAMNAAWGHGSSFPAFGTNDTFPNAMRTEIMNNVTSVQPRHYSARWAEGGTAMADFDAYRSYSMKVRWLDTRSKILANHPNTLFGSYNFGVYGLEDFLGSYYNYSAQRSGVLADDLAQYVDFVNTFYHTPKQIESATQFWHGKGVDLIAFVHETGDVTEQFGSDPQRLSDGAYSDIPGLYGIVYQNSYPVYSALKQAVKSGAIPAIYAWDDYPLWNVNTADVREDASLFRTNVIDAP